MNIHYSTGNPVKCNIGVACRQKHVSLAVIDKIAAAAALKARSGSATPRLSKAVKDQMIQSLNA